MTDEVGYTCWEVGPSEELGLADPFAQVKRDCCAHINVDEEWREKLPARWWHRHKWQCVSTTCMDCGAILAVTK